MSPGLPDLHYNIFDRYLVSPEKVSSEIALISITVRFP
jgi:hypothetical protein